MIVVRKNNVQDIQRTERIANGHIVLSNVKQPIIYTNPIPKATVHEKGLEKVHSTWHWMLNTSG